MDNDNFEIEKLLIKWHQDMINEPNDGKRATLLVMVVNDIKDLSK